MGLLDHRRNVGHCFLDPAGPASLHNMYMCMLGKGKSGGNAEAASRVQSARIIPHLPDGPRQLTDAFIDVVADHMANIGAPLSIWSSSLMALNR